MTEEIEGADALVAAEGFESRGLMTQAEAAYAKAVVDSDIASLEKYARFLRRTGRLTKSLEINRRILDQLALSKDSSTTTILRTRILAGIGIVQRKLGDLSGSRYSLNEAVQTARQGGEAAREAMAYALDNLGITATRAGDRAQALDCFRQALAIRQEITDSAGQAQTLMNLARLHRKHGAMQAAKEACLEAAETFERLNDQPGLAAAKSTMGEISEQEGDGAGAERHFKESLKINESFGMPDNIALSLVQLSRNMMERGDLAAAEVYAERSLKENERSSNREGIVASTHLLGRILARTERVEMSTELLTEAAVAYASIGNHSGEAWAKLHLAQAYRKLGDDSAASQAMEEARVLAAIIDNSRLRSLIDEES